MDNDDSNSMPMTGNEDSSHPTSTESTTSVASSNGGPPSDSTDTSNSSSLPPTSVSSSNNQLPNGSGGPQSAGTPSGGIAGSQPPMGMFQSPQQPPFGMPPPFGAPIGLHPAGGFPPFNMPPPGFPPNLGGFPGGPGPGALPPASERSEGLDKVKLEEEEALVRAKAAEWTEHQTTDGRSYYYHGSTSQSVWIKPEAIMKFERKYLENHFKFLSIFGVKYGYLGLQKLNFYFFIRVILISTRFTNINVGLASYWRVFAKVFPNTDLVYLWKC